MTYNDGLAKISFIGSNMPNSIYTSAYGVLTNSSSTNDQKVTACNSLVTEHNNSVIETTYAQDSFDAVDIIAFTVNPNGPKPSRPH